MLTVGRSLSLSPPGEALLRAVMVDARDRFDGGCSYERTRDYWVPEVLGRVSG